MKWLFGKKKSEANTETAAAQETAPAPVETAQAPAEAPAPSQEARPEVDQNPAAPRVGAGPRTGPGTGPRPAQEPVQEPGHAAAADPQASQGIYLPKSALAAIESNPAEVVSMAGRFVTALTEKALYTPIEAPRNALLVHQTDYYRQQVETGGHSQLIRNTRAKPSTFAFIERGLEASGAAAHLAIFQEMKAWVMANPDEAKAQTGIGTGRAAALEALDQKFAALEAADPLTPRLAHWLAALPETRGAELSEIVEHVAAMAAANPKHGERVVARRVGTIGHWLTDPLRFAIGYACLHKEKAGVAYQVGSGSTFDINGAQVVAWGVQESAEGQCYAVLGSDGVALYAATKTEGSPTQPGQRIGFTPKPQIDAAVAGLKGRNDAAAIDLLLRKIGDANDFAVANFDKITEPTAESPQTYQYALVSKSGGYRAVVTEDRAFLVPNSAPDKGVGVKRDDIEAHAERVKAAFV